MTEGRVRRCAVCLVPRGVLHFNLMIGSRTPDGRATTRGAGRIDLCSDCWKTSNQAAAMRPRIPRATGAAAA